MLTQFLFRLTQLKYVHAAMGKLSNFRPKGKSPAQVQAMIEASETARDLYVEKQTALQEGQGAVHTAHDQGHAAAIRVYGLMKETYIDNSTQLHKIMRIPKAGHSPNKTLVRMQKTSEVWGKLPNPPGSVLPFAADDITLEHFDELTETLENEISDCVACASDFDEAEADLHKPQRANELFVGAALKLGRALFRPGTTGRGLIDGIPTRPSTQKPDKAIIDVAESPANGSSRLRFSANGATSFEIYRKGPGQTAYTRVAEVLGESEYEESGLAGGNYSYKVVPVNSRGSGPESNPVAISVAAEAAA
jgi:hypothetical protein